MAALPLGLLGVAMLATGCDLLNKASDNKAAANPAMSSGTALTSDVPLTSDAAMSSDAAMTSDAANANGAPAANDAPAAEAAQPAGDATAQQGSDQAVGNAAVTSVGVFHERLSPYGQWVASESYGEVWVPRMAAGWRPYHYGHWAYTDEGWAWVATESWGWATFHYGRWYYDSSYGWAWVPGTVWAPAWVAWRDGGGYLGWAALPPTVGFTVGVGVDFGGVEIAPAYWAFVPEREILAPSIAVVIVAPERNVVIYGGTTNFTRYSVVNGRIVNAGIGVDRIGAVIGHPVPRTDIGRLGFYRPAALATAAVAAHAEFGHALGAQVAAERARGLVTAGPRGTPLAGGVGGVHTVHGAPNGALASRTTGGPGSLHRTGVASRGPVGHTTSSSNFSRSVHTTGGGFQAHSTQRSTVHTTGSSVHTTGSTAHSTRSTVHTTGSTVHSTRSTVHTTGSSVHSTGSTSHTTGSTHFSTGSTSTAHSTHTGTSSSSASHGHGSPPPSHTGHKPPLE